MARIVFDLDGTLIDSAPDLHFIANGVLEAEGKAPITLDDAREFVGNGASVFVAKMRAARSIPDSEHDRLLADFMARYEFAVDHTVPYAGVIEALSALKAAGHILGICTNKPLVPTRAVLDHLGLTPFFDCIYGGDSLPTHKPDPAPLIAAYADLGEGPRVYVGDSDVDAETAQRADVPFLLFTEGYRKSPVEALFHTHAFDDFAALARLVETTLTEDA